MLAAAWLVALSTLVGGLQQQALFHVTANWLTVTASVSKGGRGVENLVADAFTIEVDGRKLQVLTAEKSGQTEYRRLTMYCPDHKCLGFQATFATNYRLGVDLDPLPSDGVVHRIKVHV